MFKLKSVDFEIDENESDILVALDDDGCFYELYIEITAKEKEYDGNICSPIIRTNQIETKLKNTQELIGFKFTVSTMEEAYEREDMFYLYEHEPFEYQLEIMEIKDDKAHVLIKGTVVEDGHAEPYTTAPLEVDCWLKLKY